MKRRKKKNGKNKKQKTSNTFLFPETKNDFSIVAANIYHLTKRLHKNLLKFIRTEKKKN